MREVLFLFRYWTDKRGRKDALLLGLTLSLAVGSVYLGVEFNRWSGSFYNALQALDAGKTYALLGTYLALLAGIVATRVAVTYLKERLALRWRAWLTEMLLGKWLHKGRHYRLETQAGHDNPDQRLAEDTALFSRGVLDASLSLLSSVLSLISFSAILWQLSASMPLPVLGDTIPGYLVWACVIYTLAGSLITHWLGKALAGIQFLIQRKEAELRRVLLGQRHHGESISFQRGEPTEQARAMERLGDVVEAQEARIRKEKNLSLFTVAYGQASGLVPIFCAIPVFLSGKMQLGGLMQTSQAFMQVSMALSWFIFAYKDLAQLAATVRRLSGFIAALREAGGESATSVADDRRLVFSGTVTLPDGTALAPLALTLAPRERLWLQGSSGLGKTSLTRLLAGLWPAADGSAIRLPQGRGMFLPQNSHIAEGSLIAALAYPHDPSTVSREACRAALAASGLENLGARLDEEADWMRRLSGGERQRLALARLFLHRPDWVVMDEPINKLDDATASELLASLYRELPELTSLTISHQPLPACAYTRRQQWGATPVSQEAEPCPA
ncbi:ABC transporter ATP-binding protein/permease [Paludibacterium paludis]|nr:SbmA/BacA-like family transporter [Paludibacterium paludis]